MDPFTIGLGIVALGGLIFGTSGCESNAGSRGYRSDSDDSDAGSTGGSDAVNNNTADAGSWADLNTPDVGSSPDTVDSTDTYIATPDADTKPVGPIDNDGDGFYMCTEEDVQLGKICDCNDYNAFIKPSILGDKSKYVAQRLVNFDTNCDGSTYVDINKDAAKFLGMKKVDLGDVNHDGYADVIGASPAETSANNGEVGAEGKVGIFFGGPNKFKPGETYTLDQADVILIGGGGWTLGGSLAAVPVGTDDNNDGKVDNSDHCNLMLSAHPNNGEYDPIYGGGAGNPAEGDAAVLFVKGRQVWEKKYAFYDVPGMNDEHIVDGHNAQSLTQNKMGIINSNADGFNISYGKDFDGDGKLDVMLGETTYATVHIVPAKEYLGIQWLQDVQTTLIRDFSIGSSIAENGHHKIDDVTGDGIPDLILADQGDFPSIKGYLTVIQGSNNTPTSIDLQPNHQPPIANTPFNYFTFTGEHSGDGAGSALTVGDFDGDKKCDLGIGVSGESGPMISSGKIYTLFANEINKSINGLNNLFTITNGSNIVLDGDVEKLNGKSISGDNNQTYLTSNNAIGVADFNGDGQSELVAGAQFHPQGARSYVADMLGVKQSPAFDVSADTLDHVLTGAGEFGSAYSHGADVDGSKGDSILITDPAYQNNKGAAYLFFGGHQ